MSADVLVYLTSWCPYCNAAKELLRDKNVAFAEVDVDGRQDLRRWLVSASGQRTVPQVFINGQPVGGFSDLERLEDEGKLTTLLAEAPTPGLAPLPR
jgi:glutaredoxin 3